MTPEQLLDNVKNDITPVLYLEDDALESLLSKALFKYQEEVGPTKTVTIPLNDEGQPVIAIPSDYLEYSLCNDARMMLHDIEIIEETIVVLGGFLSVPPYKLEYFINITDMDIDSDHLPANSISVLWDYLKALIELPNTIRARSVALATGRVDEFQTDADLKDAIAKAEEAMIERRAILNPVVAGGYS